MKEMEVKYENINCLLFQSRGDKKSSGNAAVIVQINPGHTGFDSIADLNIREGSDEVFQKLKKLRDATDERG